jgi:predicted 3-demethylubiquinone-9 3-methyltransferase (glyoxalase superfamily)
MEHRVARSSRSTDELALLGSSIERRHAPLTSHRRQKGEPMPTLTPCLWFDTEGEDAATFYTSVFPNSKILEVTHYGSAGPRAEGMVMTVSFELDGEKFIALNGGPDFSFNEAISFEVSCESQEEVDSYWTKLSDGGEEGPCGWLKDRFGVSWQIVPTVLVELLADPDQEKAQRVMAAMLKMRKIDVDELERAAEAA